MARRSRLVSPATSEMIGSSVKVVEDVLLVAARARLVPPLTMLEPAAEAGDGVQPAGRVPRGDARLPPRAERDREPAVAGQDRRRVGVRRDVVAMDEEQTDVCAIRGAIRDASDGEPAGQTLTSRGRRHRRRQAVGSHLPQRRRGVEGVDDDELLVGVEVRDQPVVDDRDQLTDTADDRRVERLAVGVEAVHRVDRRRAGHQQQSRGVTASSESTCSPSTTIVCQASVPSAIVGGELDAHDPAARRVEIGDADEEAAVGGLGELRPGVDADDERGPEAGFAVEDVDVLAAIADLDVDDEPASIG